MGGLFQRIREGWNGADRTQRIMVLGGIIGLLVLIGGTFAVASRPKYILLYPSIADSEKGPLSAALQTLGVDYKVSDSGLIMVPENVADDTRFRLSATNAQPKSQDGWVMDELGKMPLGATPSVEQERLKAILEGRLSRTIQNANGLQQVTVTLTMPPRAVFQTEEKPPTASVLLVESSGVSLGKSRAKAIAQYVAGAVPRMSPRDVTVINQDLVTLWSRDDMERDNISSAENKSELQESEARNQTEKLQALLDRAFGPGKTAVTVNLELDLSPQQTTRVQRTPSDKPVSVLGKEEVYQGTSGAGLQSGAVANIGGGNNSPASQDASAKDRNYTGNSTEKVFVTNEIEDQTTKAVGDIKSMSINVVADRSKITNLAEVTAIVVGQIKHKVELGPDGLPLPNQPYQVTVQGVEFDRTAEAAAAQATETAATQARTQQIISLLPIGALLFIGLLVLRQLGRFAKQFAPVETVTATTPEGIALSLPSGMPHLSPSESAQVESVLAQLTGGGTGLLSAEEQLSVEDIKDKVNMPLEQLRKMASERPTVVAMLIKSLLLEDRR